LLAASNYSQPAEVDAIRTALVVVWVFVLGASLGSFLNVVIYRLPRGMSLSFPGSHCPGCQHPIRWYDNLPIVGWLKLRGRCRDCGSPISFRYPAIEMLVAAVALLLAWADVFSGNLARAGIEPRSIDAWGLFAYHLVLVCTLLAAAYIVYDGLAPPARLFALALIVGVAVPLVDPQVGPLGGGLLPLDRFEACLSCRLAETAAAPAAGLLMGMLAWPGTSVGPLGKNQRVPALLATTAVGTFLGWQAACAIAACAMLVLLVSSAVERLLGYRYRLDYMALVAALSIAWCATSPARHDPKALGLPDDVRLTAILGLVVAAASLAVWALERPGVHSQERVIL